MNDDRIPTWLDDLGDNSAAFDVLPPIYHRAAELVRAALRAATVADELAASSQKFDEIATNARNEGRVLDEAWYLLIHAERGDAADRIRRALDPPDPS